MDLKQLEYFVRVAELGSFTRASMALNVAQPALSRQVRLRGGQVAGEQVAVTAATLFQNRDYPVLNDYRAVLGGLFARLYGLNAAAVARVFPGTKGADLRLV